MLAVCIIISGGLLDLLFSLQSQALHKVGLGRGFCSRIEGLLSGAEFAAKGHRPRKDVQATSGGNPKPRAYTGKKLKPERKYGLGWKKNDDP